MKSYQIKSRPSRKGQIKTQMVGMWWKNHQNFWKCKNSGGTWAPSTTAIAATCCCLWKGEISGYKTTLLPLSFYVIDEFHCHLQNQIINTNNRFLFLFFYLLHHLSSSLGIVHYCYERRRTWLIGVSIWFELFSVVMWLEQGCFSQYLTKGRIDNNMG